MRTLLGTVLLLAAAAGTASAYPEFQRYSKANSGRFVNCAMCHTHSDGPEGLKQGQIGGLSDDDLNQLGLARQAFEPGAGVKSPILNEFGNDILNRLGKNKITEMKERPERLAEALAKDSDLDRDGIPDAEEYRDGTHPLNSLDGHPWKLFKNNFVKNGFHIAMMILATGCGIYGLYHALLWLSVKAGKEK